jgi:signal transduction histidine kinase
MTTSAADRDASRQLLELEERTRTAWEDYRSSVSELAGSEYDETEPVSWDRLQQALHEVADERERLVGVGSSSSSNAN